MAHTGAIPKATRTFQSRYINPQVTSGRGSVQVQQEHGALVPKDIKKETKPYENPAFSIALKNPPKNPLLADKEKRKTIRRNAPPAEDLKKIRSILQSIRNDKTISASEFIKLIGPSTGDNGDILRSVLQEDMISFKNLARKIYDTMTQDVSDVLTNQHIQLKEFAQERCTLYTEKMMRAINEVLTIDPGFDFEMYYHDPQKYLLQRFPIPKQLNSNSSEAELCRRQMAYHRMNWLKAEGERLAAENAKLQQRLDELKKEQKHEMILAQQREEEAEQKREQLEAETANVQSTLTKLADNVEKTMISTEKNIRVEEDKTNLKSLIAVGRKTSERKIPKRRKRPEWVSDTAVEIEEAKLEETLGVEGHHHLADEAVASTLTEMMRKRHGKMESKKDVKSPQQTDREHPVQKLSPTHYREHQNLTTAKVHTSTVVTEERAGPSRYKPQKELPPQSQDVKPEETTSQQKIRRNLQPKDTWGGFY